MTTNSANVTSSANVPNSVVLTGLAFCVALGVVAALVYRLRYGIDLTDESLYAAIPYRFVLGDRPFVDEASPVQTSSLIIQPLVWAYVRLSGGTEGVLIFLRVAHLLFSLALSTAAASALSFVIRREYAWCVGLLCAAFVPHCIPSLSYNTLGSGLFTVGVLLGALPILRDEARGLPFLGGLAHAACALAYPPLGVAVAAYLLILLETWRRGAGALPRAYCAGLLLGCVAVSGLLLSFGIENLARVFSSSSSFGDHGGGTGKLFLLLGWLEHSLMARPSVVLVAIGLALGMRGARPWQRWISVIAVLSLPLAMLSGDAVHPYTQSLVDVFYVGLLAPFFALSRSHPPKSRAFLIVLMLSCPVAATTCAYISTNGLRVASLGMVPALLVVGVGCVEILRRAAEGGGSADGAGRGRWRLLVPVLPVVALHAVLLGDYYSTVYKFGDLSSRSVQVASGPFAGLWAQPEKARFLALLQADLRRILRPTDRVLFYDDLPAGYLMTAARPATNTAWIPNRRFHKNYEPRMLLDYYEREGIEPTVIVRRLWRAVLPKRHSLDAYVTPRFEPVVVRPEYVISRARMDTAAP